MILLAVDSAEVALSFSGCGFLGTYHFGVISCFIRNGSVGFFIIFKRVSKKQWCTTKERNSMLEQDSCCFFHD